MRLVQFVTPLILLPLSGCVALLPSAWTAEGYTLDVSHLGNARSITGKCFQLTSDARLSRQPEHIEINLGRSIHVDGWLSPRDLSAQDGTLPKGSTLVVEKVIRHGNVEDDHERIYARVTGLLLDTTTYFYVEDSQYKYHRDYLLPCGDTSGIAK